MRVSTLLLVSLPLSQAMDIIYEPATGYYRCPATGMICNIIGCGNGSCSIISNGFDISIVGNRTVYTSTSDDADISITGGEGTAIACDISCECQSIISDKGCNQPISSRADEVFGGGLVDSTGGEVAQANTVEDSSAKCRTVL